MLLVYHFDIILCDFSVTIDYRKGKILTHHGTQCWKMNFSLSWNIVSHDVTIEAVKVSLKIWW